MKPCPVLDEVYWTKTAVEAVSKLDADIVPLVIEKAQRRLKPLPRNKPEAWRALDLLDYVVMVKEDERKKCMYVLTIGKRENRDSAFKPITD